MVEKGVYPQKRRSGGAATSASDCQSGFICLVCALATAAKHHGPGSQFQKLMQQFMPTQPSVVGQGVHPTRLDSPAGTRVAALPGTPDAAATNRFNQQKNLEPEVKKRSM